MATKKTLQRKWYKLIKDVPFSEGVRKAGKKVLLTEEGRKYFKSLNYIK